MKGGEAIKGQSNMAYLWNVMGRKTRFLLASKLSEHRDVQGADRAFTDAYMNNGQKMPEKVYTDAHKSYRVAINRWSQSKRPEHIAKAGIKKPHANNNQIERLNGTLRERVKVQRGWKSMETPLAEGQRIQYNFVKPHHALDGQTPAESAGIGVGSRDKWLEMLRESITRSGTGGRIRK